jgi:adenosylcobinamide kinase/adenosylcobinamide-phosphate guanylyltransferase
MTKRIILITGGQRSGKSEKAEELALSLSPNPVYVATAHVWDDEFRERIRRHQERRGPQWTNIEEELYLSRHDLTGRVAVIDCVTLWLTNWIVGRSALPLGSSKNASERCCLVGNASERCNAEESETATFGDVAHYLDAAKAEFDRFTAHDATYIFVTNEIGLGGTSENALQRRFTDLQGWMNQYIAARADEVILMVSGIPVKIK